MLDGGRLTTRHNFVFWTGVKNNVMVQAFVTLGGVTKSWELQKNVFLFFVYLKIWTMDPPF